MEISKENLYFNSRALRGKSCRIYVAFQAQTRPITTQRARKTLNFEK